MVVWRGLFSYRQQYSLSQRPKCCGLTWRGFGLMILTLSLPHFLFCNFASYRFQFRKLQISILQITYGEFTSQNKDFHFVSFCKMTASPRLRISTGKNDSMMIFNKTIEVRRKADKQELWDVREVLLRKFFGILHMCCSGFSQGRRST